MIYVIGYRIFKKDFIIIFNMDGVVQMIIDIKLDKININYIIFYFQIGWIFVVFIDGFVIFLLEIVFVLLKEINKVYVNYMYFKIVCFDNFGNFIIGLRFEIFVIDLSLECFYEMEIGFFVFVILIVVDK